MAAEKSAASAETAPAIESTEAAEAGAVDELAVLFPDVEVTVRDPENGAAVELIVREFRFREGLEAQAAARPLIESLTALAERAAADGTDDAEIGVAAIEAVIGQHPEIWLDLVARASGREATWLASLSDADGRAFTLAMWQANAPFFVRRVIAGAVENAEMARLFRSLASSIRSSPPATDADITTSAGA